jgi:hypothetical protein
MQQQSTASSSRVKPVPVADPIFDGYMERLQRRLVKLLDDPRGGRLYTTDVGDLFETYLAAFPEDIRQHHNCHACRAFLNSFGGLVTIDGGGEKASPLWDPSEAPEPYVGPVRAILSRVTVAKVTGVFFPRKRQLGSPLAGGWTHLAAMLPGSCLGLHSETLAPGQAEAEKQEDMKNLSRALGEFTQDALDQAVQVLRSEALYRSEKLLGAAEWLAGLQKMRSETKDREVRNNLFWRAVALAPAGFCHPRSGMLGTLLEDIEAHLPFDEIKRRFDEKMHPLQYQRPQAAPTAGAIAQAEKLVEQMGIAASLKRRFARLDEIETIWRPQEAKPQSARDGVFGHLVPKGEEPLPALEVPAQSMTWEKFQRTILPEAQAIEFWVRDALDHYCALTTAADGSAPPILQWDSAERRNPFAWYVYHSGSSAEHFGLRPETWTRVTAVTLQPTAWHGRRFEHDSEAVVFCLEGCRDTVNRGGLALFPECMKSELHGVRSVIEAHSRSGRIEDVEGPVAAGIRLQKGAPNGQRLRLRVTSGSVARTIDLDRWD